MPRSYYLICGSRNRLDSPDLCPSHLKHYRNYQSGLLFDSIEYFAKFVNATLVALHTYIFLHLDTL